ncbi:MAG: hypothetical protein V1735_06300 [Nanoarchaeota archaeon]
MGQVVQQDVRDDLANDGRSNCSDADSWTNCSTATNASIAALQGVDKVAKWQKTWGTVIGVGVVLGILGAVFMLQQKGSQ